MDKKDEKKKLLLEKMKNAKIEIQNLHSGEQLLSPIEKSTITEEEKKMRDSANSESLSVSAFENKTNEKQSIDINNLEEVDLMPKLIDKEELNNLTEEDIERKIQERQDKEIAIKREKDIKNNPEAVILKEIDADEELRKNYIKSLNLTKLKVLDHSEVYDCSYDSVEKFIPLKYPDEPTRMIGQDIEKFMIWAVAQGTSDVFIQSDEKITCDIYGRKHKVTRQKISNPQVIQMISYIYKSESALSTLNGGKDVDCQWSIQIGKTKSLRFRINITSHQAYGSKGYEITIRTINGRAPLLETQNLPANLIKRLSPKQGLIMVAGATGSGKSTLLASILDWRMRNPQAHVKILSYEKPIEFVYDEVDKPTSVVSQVEVGVHLGSFEEGIVNSLRRKPDIILVGEMRDKETIGEGITASMTGHLVFGTVHAISVANTIGRMINVFGEGEKNARKADIIGSIQMIIAQKLLISTDGKRVPVREYLYFDNQMKDRLANLKTEELIPAIQELVEKSGQSFIDDITEKFLEGRISKAIYDEELLTLGYK